MTYNEAMRALNDAVYDAVRAANNHDGAPVQALKELASEIDCLIDHNCTRAEFNGCIRCGETGELDAHDYCEHCSVDMGTRKI